MYRAALDQIDNLDTWMDAARPLLANHIPPDAIAWQVGDCTSDLFADTPPPPPVPTASGLRVPASFRQLAGTVVLHRDPARFNLLYTLAWRLQQERRLMTDAADPLMGQLQTMAKQVGRDIHKMRAFLRFREIDGRFVAWFEPDHHILRANGGFFVRRFAAMHWSILTPELSLHWDGLTLKEGPPAKRHDAPQGDPLEHAWRAYYAAIFNPARLKIDAMLKEMPRRYWKNMPEAGLIGDLIAGAQAREAGMIAAAQAKPARATSLSALAQEARSCARCPIGCQATQLVFGEGPPHAHIMVVGEQPGDAEDLAGRPFVGPAGQLLGTAFEAVGLDRQQLYITNAVKHFKHVRRGKMRLHQTPNAGEIDHCRWWLDQERAMIRPSLIIMLGASALRAVTGRQVKLGDARGRVLALQDGAYGIATYHPSHILRSSEETTSKARYQHFVEDLARARSIATNIGAAPNSGIPMLAGSNVLP